MKPSTVPTARGNPLFGMALELRRDELGTLERARAEHGDVVRFVIGPPGLGIVTYAVCSPEGAQQVLTGRGFARARLMSKQIAAAFGNGLFTSDGELWRRQRRTLQPLFTPRQVPRYTGAIVEEGEAAMRRWAHAGGQIDVHAELSQVTLRIVTRVLFGADGDAAEEVIRTAFPVLSEHVFRRLHQRYPTPWGWPTPRNRRAQQARAALNELVDGLVAQRQTPTEGEPDLVSLLVQKRDPETGQPMSHEQVRDEALVFLLAGHETNATSLTFALLLLAQHPEAQDRVRDEVDAVLSGQPPDADVVTTLPYTAMVLKEAMRLYPPAWVLPRETLEDAVIDGHPVPAGQLTFVNTWVIHRHPGLWEEPRRFDPERFTPEGEATRHRYAYLPFGGGPHTCIGIHLAQLEGAILLATIVRAFRLHAEQGPVPLVPAITLRPRDPVRVQITRR